MSSAEMPCQSARTAKSSGEEVTFYAARNFPGGEVALVLVVDDNPLNCDMTARRLARNGYSVAVCYSGRAALNWLCENNTNLVLLDIAMPHMDGFEVLRILRQCYTAAELPIIMLTAKAMNEDVVHAMQLGANDYAAKPINFPDVLRRIEIQLAGHTRARIPPRPEKLAQFLLQPKESRFPKDSPFVALYESIMRRSSACQDGNHCFALICLAGNHDSLIEKDLGQNIKERLHAIIAARLGTILRSQDELFDFSSAQECECGEDMKFVILLNDIQNSETAVQIAGRMLKNISQPFQFDGETFSPAANIGIAFGKGRYQQPETMMLDAKSALHRALNQGPGHIEISINDSSNPPKIENPTDNQHPVQ